MSEETKTWKPDPLAFREGFNDSYVANRGSLEYRITMDPDGAGDDSICVEYNQYREIFRGAFDDCIEAANADLIERIDALMVQRDFDLEWMYGPGSEE